MIHLEAKGKHGQLAKYNLANVETVFAKAAALLRQGYPSVKVWLNGDRNVPLELRTDNIDEMYAIHGKGD
jgi:hypothetical protein